MKREEKAVSKAQQALFGIALSVKRGDKKLEDVPSEHQEKVKGIIDSMDEKEIEKFAKTKTEDLLDKVEEALKNNRMPTLQDVYENQDLSGKIKEILDFVSGLGYAAEIKNGHVIISDGAIDAGSSTYKNISDFVGRLGLRSMILPISGKTDIQIFEDGEASLDSAVGRGEFSLGNDTSNSSDNTKGSGEKFGDLKKKKIGEEQMELSEYKDKIKELLGEKYDENNMEQYDIIVDCFTASTSPDECVKKL